MIKRRTILTLALFVLMLAACSPEQVREVQEGITEDSNITGNEVIELPLEEQLVEEPPNSGISVLLANSSLGQILVTEEGFSLYMFTNDSENTSSCNGGCALRWPPLITEGAPIAGQGAADDLLGTLSRDDGSLQVTYNGWPLYRFSADAAPGDMSGQGVNGIWFVLSAVGEPLSSASADVEVPDEDAYQDPNY